MDERYISPGNRKLVKIISEELWLTYFNNYLFKKGVITEREYWIMFNMIIQRTARKKKALEK